MMEMYNFMEAMMDYTHYVHGVQYESTDEMMNDGLQKIVDNDPTIQKAIDLSKTDVKGATQYLNDRKIQNPPINGLDYWRHTGEVTPGGIH